MSQNILTIKVNHMCTPVIGVYSSELKKMHIHILVTMKFKCESGNCKEIKVNNKLKLFKLHE